MRFKIITAGWNCFDHMGGYFRTVGAQKVDGFDGYDVMIVDDSSSDERQRTKIVEECEKRGWSFILNDTHRGAMYNQVHAIRALDPKPEDVLVFVDLDDALNGKNVLSFLASHYADPELLLTYGNYRTFPYSSTCSRAVPYPDWVIERNDYRDATWRKTGVLFNHLRTFRASLFYAMDESDWTWPDGTWFETNCDTAMMIPGLELAGPRHKCFQEDLLVYTSDNPLSDWRRDAATVDKTNHYILSKIKPKAMLP